MLKFWSSSISDYWNTHFHGVEKSGRRSKFLFLQVSAGLYFALLHITYCISVYLLCGILKPRSKPVGYKAWTAKCIWSKLTENLRVRYKKGHWEITMKNYIFIWTVTGKPRGAMSLLSLVQGIGYVEESCMLLSQDYFSHAYWMPV